MSARALSFQTSAFPAKPPTVSSSRGTVLLLPFPYAKTPCAFPPPNVNFSPDTRLFSLPFQPGFFLFPCPLLTNQGLLTVPCKCCVFSLSLALCPSGRHSAASHRASAAVTRTRTSNLSHNRKSRSGLFRAQHVIRDSIPVDPSFRSFPHLGVLPYDCKGSVLASDITSMFRVRRSQKMSLSIDFPFIKQCNLF